VDLHKSVAHAVGLSQSFSYFLAWCYRSLQLQHFNSTHPSDLSLLWDQLSVQLKH
jgi:hypothetical protein